MTRFTCNVCKKSFASKQRLISHGKRKTPCKPPPVVNSNIAVNMVLTGITYNQLVELIGEDKIVSSQYVNLDKKEAVLTAQPILNIVKQDVNNNIPVNNIPVKPVKKDTKPSTKKKVKQSPVKNVNNVKQDINNNIPVNNIPINNKPPVKKDTKKKVKQSPVKNVNNVKHICLDTPEVIQQHINDIDKKIEHTDKMLDLSVRTQNSSVLKKETRLLLEEKNKLVRERVNLRKTLKKMIKNEIGKK
mgnify:FL=1